MIPMWFKTAYPSAFCWCLLALLLSSSSTTMVVVVATTDASSCANPDALRNAALVFVKPHANTVEAQDLVRQTLRKHGIDIVSETSIDAATIEKEKLIDQHYYAIASKATLVPASKIPVPEQTFEEEFGESWKTVVKEKRALNALEACRRFQWTAEQLGQAWQEAKAVKFGGGFYCARINHPQENEQATTANQYYIFNGFFLTMRSQFVETGASIFCFEVEWDPKALSWADFRTKVLGPTDPHQAPRGSLRRTILDQFRALGLQEPPNKGLNGVHGSASPFEGLVERMNWLQKDVTQDEYGKALLAAGLAKKRIREWSTDPRIKIDGEGTMGSLFDALDEMDAPECLEKLVELSRL